MIDTDDTVLATRSFPTTRNGYRTMLTWIGEYGALIRIGVEGTGSYGAGLTRHLAKAGVTVLEVDRPDRSDRRRKGKDDDLDPINAARAAKTNRRTTTPKPKDGAVEPLRALGVTRAHGTREAQRTATAADDDHLRSRRAARSGTRSDADATDTPSRSVATGCRERDRYRDRLPSFVEVLAPAATSN